MVWKRSFFTHRGNKSLHWVALTNSLYFCHAAYTHTHKRCWPQIKVQTKTSRRRPPAKTSAVRDCTQIIWFCQKQVNKAATFVFVTDMNPSNKEIIKCGWTSLLTMTYVVLHWLISPINVTLDPSWWTLDILDLEFHNRCFNKLLCWCFTVGWYKGRYWLMVNCQLMYQK